MPNKRSSKVPSQSRSTRGDSQRRRARQSSSAINNALTRASDRYYDMLRTRLHGLDTQAQEMSARAYQDKLHDFAYGKIKVWDIDRRAVQTFLSERRPKHGSGSETLRYWAELRAVIRNRWSLPHPRGGPHYEPRSHRKRSDVSIDSTYSWDDYDQGGAVMDIMKRWRDER